MDKMRNVLVQAEIVSEEISGTSASRHMVGDTISAAEFDAVQLHVVR